MGDNRNNKCLDHNKPNHKSRKKPSYTLTRIAAAVISGALILTQLNIPASAVEPDTDIQVIQSIEDEAQEETIKAQGQDTSVAELPETVPAEPEAAAEKTAEPEDVAGETEIVENAS